MNSVRQEFSVIGMGRFGKFWAGHLARFYPVICFDTNPERLVESVSGVVPDSLENCLQKPFIFLTIPIHVIPDFLKQNRNGLQPGSVIIDCASVKEPVLDWFRKYIPEDVHYAASHPLFGPDSAHLGLKGHAITLIPGRIPFHLYQFLVILFTNKFDLTVLNMSSAEHDKMMAYNLSLMHHLGRTFDRMKISHIPLLMSNLEKMKRMTEIVMRDSDELFTDFYKWNSYSAEIRDEFVSQFSRITQELTLVKRRSGSKGRRNPS